MMPHVPIPERMAHLPRDHRGWPIPAILYRDEHGVAHFTINDERRRQQIIRQDLCSICGTKLFRGRWFVGGELSAFDPRGCYLDPPMHDECVHYALRVCPYLAAPNYNTLLADKTLAATDTVEIAPKDEAHIDEVRPAVFVAVFAVGQQWVNSEVSPSVQYLRPRRPYRRWEYWLHGQQIDDETARPLILERMRERAGLITPHDHVRANA